MSREQEILARAEQQDANRQRQIQNQKDSIDRLLEREQAVRHICNQALVEGSDTEVVDRILDVLNGKP